MRMCMQFPTTFDSSVAEITGTSSTAELKETVGESVLLLSRDFG